MRSALLAFLFLCPHASAFHDSIVTIGDGTTSHGRFNGTDEGPFDRALRAAPDGGVIEVLPGTYTFTKPLVITNEGLTLRGSSGAVLACSNDPAVGLFDIEAARVALTGIQISVPQAVASQVAIFVDADDVTIDHSYLGVGTGALDFRLIDIGDGQTPRSGVRIESNTFALSKASAGVVGVRGRLGSGLTITNNDFRVGGFVPSGLCRYALELQSQAHGVITGNSFQDMGTGAAPIDSVIAVTSDAASPGLVIRGNFFEHCLGPNVILVRGGRFCSITGNVIGRMTLATAGAIAFEAAPGGSPGESNIVSGNELHNVALGIRVDAQKWLVAEANQFTLCSTRQIEVTSSAVGTSIVANQFVSSGANSISEAIYVGGGSGHLIHDNQVGSEVAGKTFQFVVNALAPGTNVSDNWKS